MKCSVVVMSSISVYWVVAKNGTQGANEAFELLESFLPTLRGRKFYGVYDIQTALYRACVAKLVDELVPLEEWTIPGGVYAKVVIKNWDHDPKKIALTFHELAKEVCVDETRSSLEFYRRFDEPHLLLPLIDK